MAQIDDFKANLIGGGARANQFRITITPPPGISIGLDVRRTSFLVTTAGIPDVAMNFIAVPFRGRNIQYPGDRSDPGDWTTTFYNGPPSPRAIHFIQINMDGTASRNTCPWIEPDT